VTVRDLKADKKVVLLGMYEHMMASNGVEWLSSTDLNVHLNNSYPIVYLRKILESLEAEELIRSRQSSNASYPVYTMAEKGILVVQQTLMTDGISLGANEDEPHEASGGEIVHSEAWTGISNQTITAANADLVRSAILKAKESVRDLGSNERTAQAIALLNAAEALTDAPEPPSDFIWELINRAGALCGIIGLFISLFMLA
jgi:hypothetical protein